MSFEFHISSDLVLNQQATAIQFNKQECAAVNETAPDFVGCSPAGLSSALASMSLSQITTAGSSTASSATTTSSSVNPLLSTITGNVITEMPPMSTSRTPTATFAGRPLMTGSCTVPYFAFVTGSNNEVIEYPAIGCSDQRPDCCPYEPGTNALITQCPQDYFSTASACCPFGYQIYYTALGSQTPCYSNPSTTLVPASTPTDSGVTLITEHVFSDMYMLAPTVPPKHTLPTAAVIGISVNAVLFIAVIISLWWWFGPRKRRRARAAAARTTTFPPEEPALPQMSRAPTMHELDSPERQAGSPGALSRWGSFPASSPPAYDQEKGKPKPKPKPIVPQELPGSTWINEHHPAYSGDDTSTPTEVTQPSPPRTPIQKATPTEPRSPVVSAITSRSGNQSPSFVSPLGSPRLPHTP
ncbi:hypothetical protein H2202_010402 [Exophiala xenobiotica]|nr:hypothetical protein H2202_010402 [Exophiala xenobiotica]